MTAFQKQFTDYIGSLAQYNLFKETIGGGPVEVVANIWNVLFKVLVDIPFFFLKFGVIVNTFIVKLLDISGPLSRVQHEALVSARNIFVSFIGGSNGSISKDSGAWGLVTITLLYLLYQFFNGKGNFRQAVLHYFSVVMTMFFFFSSFTVTIGGQTKTQMGGEIAFHLVQDTSERFKNVVTSAMTGYKGEETGDFFVNYVLKPTANFANTGNPSGSLPDGSPFDYKKANQSQAYVDDLARGEEGLKYLKNTSDALPYQMMAVAMGYGNLLVYFLPVALINAIISVTTLLLCLLLVLSPLAAFLSFIPPFRNAFFQLLGKSFTLSVAPALISVFVGFLFYLMSQIDWIVLSVVGNPHQGRNLFSFFTGMNALLYLVTLSSIFILKVVALLFLWKKRNWITQTVTGSSTLAQGAWESVRAVSDPLHETGEKVQELAQAGTLAGLGYATGNPQLMLQGASMVAPRLSRHLGVMEKLKKGFSTSSEEEELEEGKPLEEKEPPVVLPEEEGEEEEKESSPEEEPYDWRHAYTDEGPEEEKEEEDAYDWESVTPSFEDDFSSFSFEEEESGDFEPEDFHREQENAWAQAVEDLNGARG